MGQPRGRGLPGREKIECRKSENSNHFTLDDNSEKADLSDIDRYSWLGWMIVMRLMKVYIILSIFLYSIIQPAVLKMDIT